MENQPTTPQVPPSAPLSGASPDAGQSSFGSATNATPATPTMQSSMSGFGDSTPTMTTGGSSAPSPAPKGSAVKRLLAGLVILLLVGAAAGAAGYFYMQWQDAKDEVATLKSEQSKQDTGLHDLPADAIKVSECIPNMGYHYLPKDADPIYGPFYLVNKSGKIIGVEYMYDSTMLQPIPDLKPPIEVLPKNTPLYNWTYDHGEVSRANEGHEGFLKDHYDLHVYTVSTEVRAQACQ